MYTTHMPPKKSQFERYQDPTGEFTNRDLKLGSWYVRHKIFLRNLLIGTLVSWCVVTLGYSLIILGEYLFFGVWNDRDQRIAQTVQFSENAVLQPMYQATPLSFGSVRILAGGPGRYDFVLPVQNSNSRYLAHVTYSFTYAGGRTVTSTAQVLPGERQLLTALGVERTGRPSGVQFVLGGIAWQRVNPHVIADVQGYIDQRLAFTVENTEIGGGANPELANSVRFEVVNDSVHNYWSGDFFVEILRGETPVAVLPLSIPEFRAGERRSIDLRPLSDVQDASRVELTPRIDVFNQSVYIPVGS